MQNTSHSSKRFSTASTQEKISDIVVWLEEHKAADIVTLDLAGRSAFAEALLVITASSMRHGQSLADGVMQLCNEKKYEYLRMEGYQTGQWILVDLNDVIVNIFQEPVRHLYNLEALWRLPSGEEKE